MKKVTFEEMLESMSARLHLIEAENESLKMDAQESRAIANRAMLENTVSSNLPYTKDLGYASLTNSMELEKLPRVHQPARAGFPTTIRSVQHRSKDDRDSRYSLTGNALAWEINLAVYVASFHQLTADLDWNDSALRAHFTLDSATKSRTPWSTLILLQLFLGIQQAIKVDNRLYERRLERTEVRGVTPYSSPNRFFPPTRPQPPTPRTSNTPWNQPQRRPPPPSPMVVPPPRSSNDMDIDFARRGPLTSEERQQRMSRGLA
ncbi:hypothetical protein BASA83_013486 [Batrachochytrium salamandrivorans]|nr:hypothetical protein BASA83_013486 [Batrachochytrium salamandrivorans]